MSGTFERLTDIVASGVATQIISSAGTEPQVPDNAADEAAITTLSLNGTAPGTWAIAGGGWAKAQLIGDTSAATIVLAVDDVDGLASGDQGVEAVTVTNGALSLPLSITIYDSAALAAPQTITINNALDEDRTGDTIPFIMPLLFGWDEFDATTEHLEYSVASGTAAVSTCGWRTDRYGDTRMVIAGGVITPTAFGLAASVGLTATAMAGAEPTQTNVPTFAQLLAADSEFEFDFHCTLDGTPITTSLRDDSTALFTYLEGTNCACYIRRSPMLDSHRWIEWDVYIFKSDSNALTVGNLVDVAVDIRMMCGGINDATIARLPVTGLSIKRGVTAQEEVYDQTTSFTWNIHEHQKIPISRGAYHRSFWWLGKGDRIKVLPPLVNNKMQRMIDSKHALNYINTVQDWAGYDAEGAFNASGATPFTSRGLALYFNMASQGERDELGPLPAWGTAAIMAATDRNLKYCFYDSDIARGYAAMSIVHDGGVPRFPQSFTTEGALLPNALTNRGSHGEATAVYGIDRAHMHNRHYMGFILSGRYSHFYSLISVAHTIWQDSPNTTVPYGSDRTVYWPHGSNNRDGRFMAPVVHCRACMLDTWDGTAVGTTDWGKTAFDAWLDSTVDTDTPTQAQTSVPNQVRVMYELQDAAPAGTLFRIKHQDCPWFEALSTFSVAMAGDLRIWPVVNGEKFTNHHAKFWHQHSTYAGGFVWAAAPYNHLRGPNQYLVSLDSNTAKDINFISVQDAVKTAQRYIQSQHNQVQNTYGDIAGVSATIDFSDQSNVVITFSSNIFAGVTASEYTDVWDTGKGYILWINPVRTSGLITSSDGCGMIKSITADNVCVIDTTISSFALPQGENLVVFTPVTTGTWAAPVQVPPPISTWPQVPVAPHPFQQVAWAPWLSAGAAFAVFNAATSLPSGMTEAVAFYNSIMADMWGTPLGQENGMNGAKYHVGYLG